MVTKSATTVKVVKAGVEANVWDDLKKLCKKKGDLKEKVEQAINLYLSLSADPSSIESIDIKIGGVLSRKPDQGGRIYVTFRVDEKLWSEFRKSVGESSDALNRALKLYLGALHGYLAWMETSIPGTPDFTTSLANVAYDFNLPGLIGIPSVKVIPVRGKAGSKVLSYVIDEALRYKDTDGVEPDSSPAIALRKDGHLEYLTENLTTEELIERISEGWKISIRVSVNNGLGSVNIDRGRAFCSIFLTPNRDLL